jgi:chitodextrinase
MRQKILPLLFLGFFSFYLSFGQELHNQANAASINNEADGAAGWGGTAALSSDNTDAVFGDLSLRIESTANNGRIASYTFNAVSGAVYNIRIWARLGPQITNPPAPAFASWRGFQGFSVTPIDSAEWTEYVFNLTATNTSPEIRIYTGTSASNGTAGNTILIDGVSITREGSDTEGPSAITDLSASGTNDTSTVLSWSASTDNVAVTDYEIFRDGLSIGNSGVNTTFIATGLAPNNSYTFTVIAWDEVGNSSEVSNSVTVSTTDTEAPTAVSDLSASNTTDESTLLSWSATTDNVAVTAYEILQDEILIGTSGTNTSFNVSGLTAETTYTFTVVARDNAGNSSDPSNSLIVTTLSPPDGEAPSTISDLSASGTTETGTNLSWSAATDNVGVTEYEVFQDGNSIGSAGTSTNFSVNNLLPGTAYAFTVIAKDIAGNTSAESNSVTVTTLSDTEAPSSISDLTASNTSDISTYLSWTAASDNIGVVNYEIYQDSNRIGNSLTSNFYTVSGLSPNTTYNFVVVAQDAAGNFSADSNTVSVTTESTPDTEAPSAITDLVASNTTANSTYLTWSASTDNVGVSDYEVFQDGISIDSTGTNTFYSVTGLLSGNSYEFTVIAKDASGNFSSLSNTANVSTPDNEAPTAISNLSASNTSDSSTILSWSASTDNVGISHYQIYRDGVSIANNITATSYTATGLAAETAYSFVVVAFDDAGNFSSNSNVVNITTASSRDSEPPSAINNLAASNTTTNSTRLTWSASTDNVAVTNYEIFQNGSSIGNNGTNTTFDVTGLTQSTAYAFTVVAQDAEGNSSVISNTVVITTLTNSNVTDYTSENSNLNSVDWSARDLFANRNLGVGTTDTRGFSLAVAGGIVAEELTIELQANWPDYVFTEAYELPTLLDMEKHIKEKGHLMNVPSAAEIEKNGLQVGIMQAKLLEKIEELMLYTINQEKRIKALEAEILKLHEEMSSTQTEKNNNDED